jgi:single-strand DNA-binding protein
MSLQSVIFVGNLGGDPVLRFSDGGKPRATFSVAVTEGQGDNEKTHCVDVTAFNSLAENVAESLAKGMRVVVVGRIDTFKREIETIDNVKPFTTVKFIAHEVSPSLVFARAKVTKVVREHGESGNGTVGWAGDGSAAASASRSGAAPGGPRAKADAAHGGR